MGKRSRDKKRRRIGRVSVYLHHGAWWVYYRESGRPIRKKVALEKGEAEKIAAQINAQIWQGVPSLLAFTAVSVAELRRQFLDHHENALGSALRTVGRFSAATKHLENFAAQYPKPPLAHEVKPDRFAAYLRTVEVGTNGHPNSPKQKLRDKGVKFVLQTVRSTYQFAAKRGYLPPYSENPFATVPLDRFKIEDAKPLFVFDASTEAAFLRAANRWEFPIHFLFAKSGIRVSELTHLLVEDIDFAEGWLTVRNKPDLGWRVKTGSGRRIPLLPEVVAVLRCVIGDRRGGLLFRMPPRGKREPALLDDEQSLIAELRKRIQGRATVPTRAEADVIARGVWRDAGCIRSDRLRTSFARIMRSLCRPDVTCTKSWRHTFATLLQDANVDPLIRQLVMGHSPSSAGGLGMTARYTQTRAETLRMQIEQALRTWPVSLELALTFANGVAT
jgi:integrase